MLVSNCTTLRHAVISQKCMQHTVPNRVIELGKRPAQEEHVSVKRAKQTLINDIDEKIERKQVIRVQKLVGLPPPALELLARIS